MENKKEKTILPEVNDESPRVEVEMSKGNVESFRVEVKISKGNVESPKGNFEVSKVDVTKDRSWMLRAATTDLVHSHPNRVEVRRIGKSLFMSDDEDEQP